MKAKQTVDEMKEKDKEKRNYKKKVEVEIQELADKNNLKLKKVIATSCYVICQHQYISNRSYRENCSQNCFRDTD